MKPQSIMITALAGLAVSAAHAQDSGIHASAGATSWRAGAAQISFGTSLRNDGIFVSRGGAWNGPAADSLAGASLELRSANIGTTLTFDNGSHVGLSFGRLIGMRGQNYGYTGVGSTLFDDGEGTILGLSVGAPLGGGFAVEGGLRRFDLRATEFAHPDNHHGSCPGSTLANCQFTHALVTGDVMISYTGTLAPNVFFTLGGGGRLTNGYAIYEAWELPDLDETENVSPPLLG